MDRRLKIAIIGTNAGCTLHVRALRGAGFDVTALAGQDEARTQARAAHFRIAQATTSVDAVLDSDIDAVVIATPPASHFDLAMKSIAAGKHVLAEKPITLELAQARELSDAIRDAGLIGHIAHEFRWFGHNAAMRQLLRNGRLGQPLQIAANFDHPLVAGGFHCLPGWWLDPATGGGWLRNWATHGVDLIRYMVGEFAAVSGQLHNEPSSGMLADDGYSVAFRLRNDAQGVLAGSCRSWDLSNSVRVVGTKAAAGYENGALWFADETGRQPLACPAEVVEDLQMGESDPGTPADDLLPANNAYDQAHTTNVGYPEQVYLSRAFGRRIIDPSYGHPAIATFADGVRHMEIVLAIEEAARTGRWVDVRHQA